MSELEKFDNVWEGAILESAHNKGEIINWTDWIDGVDLDTKPLP